MKKLLLVLVLFGVIACESTYKPGDLTRSYCASTDLEFRATVRALLKTQGIVLPVSPCLAIGVIDALKPKPKPEL